MNKFYVTELDKAQDFSLCGNRVNKIRRNEKKNENEDGTVVLTESIFVLTECDSIEVDVPAKGRWAPLVNHERKPYGFVFKSKQTALIRILITAPKS